VVRDHANRDPVRRIGAREGNDHVDVPAPEVLGHLGAQALEVLLVDLGVDRSPPDAVLGARLADDELVLGRAAGVDARVDGQCAALGDRGFAALERVGVELGRGRIPVDPPVSPDAVAGEIVGRDRYLRAPFEMDALS
jgi:hypothetical protein